MHLCIAGLKGIVGNLFKKLRNNEVECKFRHPLTTFVGFAFTEVIQCRIIYSSAYLLRF